MPSKREHIRPCLSHSRNCRVLARPRLKQSSSNISTLSMSKRASTKHVQKLNEGGERQNAKLTNEILRIPKATLISKAPSWEPWSENEKQPEVFLQKVFLRTPRFMDVRAFRPRTSEQKTLFSCAPSDGVRESFWAGTSAHISARTSAGYPA